MTNALLLAATQAAIGMCETEAELQSFGEVNRAAFQKLAADDHRASREQYRAHLERLRQAAADAA